VRTGTVADRIRSNQRTGARFHLAPGITPLDFFKTLNERNARYVLLRWWADFPDFPEGEDYDILIADEDRQKISDLVVRRLGSYKCDIYTVAGSSDGDYLGFPYFSPRLCTALLSRRRLHNSLVYVPEDSIYFSSLLFHLLFHKTEQLFGEKYEDHQYERELTAVGSSIGESVSITPDSIFSYLNSKGFTPSGDLLAKFASKSPLLLNFLSPMSSDIRRGELLVFFVRERAVEQGLLPAFMDIILNQRGVELLASVPLDKSTAFNVAINCRGGRWDCGPYRLSGGYPAHLIACYDYYPQSPKYSQFAVHPRVGNERILSLKALCRDIILNWSFWFEHYNALHSADNENEAIEYLKVVDCSLAEKLAEAVNARRSFFFTGFPVLSVLSEGQRSKVEKIRFKGEVAIKKTFHPGFERFLDREVYAAEVLSKKFDFIPRILGRGDGYVVLQYIDSIPDIRNHDGLIAEYREAICNVITQMYEFGLDFVNFTPDNILLTTSGKFYAIDFEFLQPLMEGIVAIEDSIMVSGYTKGFTGDLPSTRPGYQSDFESVWAPYIGSWQL